MTSVNTWLLGIHEKFASDVQALMELETLWQICSKCTDANCCQRERVPVMSPEWEMITDFVRKNFNSIQKRRYQENVERERIQCPFLLRNRCEVYAVRPWSCRIYPYTISFHQTEITYQNGQFVAPHCQNLASEFNTHPGKIVVFNPVVQDRIQEHNLVKISIDNGKVFWVLDITKYHDEYEAKMPKNEDGILEGDDMHNWVGFANRARKMGVISREKFLEILGLD